MPDFFSALWMILPAYFANSSATLARGKTRIDFSKNFPDGRPIFGGGKTFEGFFLGVFAGTAAGFLQNSAQNLYGLQVSAAINPLSAGIIAFGALIGDLAGSFIKRRLGLKRGAPVPVLDQLDFVAGAIFFASLIYNIEIDTIMLLLIITPIIHLTANVIGYKIGVKKEPW
ncbi:MAG: CDP-2,3-bis-(O-geranylgeranyl)-sn-glycerol synthase [Candidatus Aenigmarchaeota archaeon]|nr:CDP-2,3-bis-(O-geranylgeranyl)-sn-glycerol synthase [Candidatus Aenigmarchaeota archaeon]